MELNLTLDQLPDLAVDLAQLLDHHLAQHLLTQLGDRHDRSRAATATLRVRGGLVRSVVVALAHGVHSTFVCSFCQARGKVVWTVCGYVDKSGSDNSAPLEPPCLLTDHRRELIRGEMRPVVLFKEVDESDKVSVDFVRSDLAHGRIEAMTLAQTTDALELPEELVVALELRHEAARVHDRLHAAQGHVSALPVCSDYGKEVEHRKSVEEASVTLSHRFVVVGGSLHGSRSCCVCVWVNLLLHKYTMHWPGSKPLVRLFG